MKSSQKVKQHLEKSVERKSTLPNSQNKNIHTKHINEIQTNEYFDYESWSSLNLIKPLLKAVNDMNYARPTKIQQMCIPAIISGKDVLGKSVTGSGKTAAFLLPMMNDLAKNRTYSSYVRALIILPTRELALQCHDMFSQLNTYTRLNACLAIGKIPLAQQEADIAKGPDIVIGTPGRIVDLSKNSKGVSFEEVEWLVFDEADKLLDMGFKAEIEEVLQTTENDERQTLLFSATLDKELQKMVKLALRNPLRVEAEPQKTLTGSLTQQVVKLKTVKSLVVREAILLHLLTDVAKNNSIIFFKTKKQCHRIKIVLDLMKVPAIELHGDLTQSQRIDAVETFDKTRCFLLATDLAARGLDFKDVEYVINFELPDEESKYIHRVGRTARAGSTGTCISLIDEDEMKIFKRMVKRFGEKIQSRKLDYIKVKALRDQIAKLKTKVKSKLNQEKTEIQFAKAEMEAQKAQNMIDYADEIFNKPKREWIVSNKERKQIASDSKKVKIN